MDSLQSKKKKLYRCIHRSKFSEDYSVVEFFHFLFSALISLQCWFLFQEQGMKTLPFAANSPTKMFCLCPVLQEVSRHFSCGPVFSGSSVWWAFEQGIEMKVIFYVFSLHRCTIRALRTVRDAHPFTDDTCRGQLAIHSLVVG